MTADVADAEGLHQLKLSGTKFRKMLRAGEDIPEWCEHTIPLYTFLLFLHMRVSCFMAELGWLRGLACALQVCLQVRGGCAAERDDIGQALAAEAMLVICNAVLLDPTQASGRSPQRSPCRQF